MAHGFDMAAAIKSTLEQILGNGKVVPLIACTDSKSLFDCLVRLGTISEKRLMIDLMSLRQSYERGEIAEVKWIRGGTNPADAMTKHQFSETSLSKLIDTNKLELDELQWVERD